jgi:hypothetical protein
MINMYKQLTILSIISIPINNLTSDRVVYEIVWPPVLIRVMNGLDLIQDMHYLWRLKEVQANRLKSR